LDGTGVLDQPMMFARTWLPTALLLILATTIAVIMMVPGFQRTLRWRLPGFRENSLTNLAGMMGLMLRSGSNMGEALDMMQTLETGSAAGRELRNWKVRLAGGQTKFLELARPSPAFPPLFLWLVAQGGEDLAAGFKRAAEVYYARALYRIELLLYAALPVLILMLGALVLVQFLPLLGSATTIVDSLGSDLGT